MGALESVCCAENRMRDKEKQWKKLLTVRWDSKGWVSSEVGTCIPSLQCASATKMIQFRLLHIMEDRLILKAEFFCAVCRMKCNDSLKSAAWVSFSHFYRNGVFSNQPSKLNLLVFSSLEFRVDIYLLVPEVLWSALLTYESHSPQYLKISSLFLKKIKKKAFFSYKICWILTVTFKISDKMSKFLKKIIFEFFKNELWFEISVLVWILFSSFS